MKKLLFVVLFALLLIPQASYSFEIIEQEKSVYKVHFGRGLEKNGVSQKAFYNFVEKEMLPNLNVGGASLYEVKGFRYTEDRKLITEFTSVVTVDLSNNSDAQIEKVAKKYLELYQTKDNNISVYIVKYDAAKTKLVY